MAKALRLKAEIRSIAMLIEKVHFYKTDESKIPSEILFKLFEWDPDFFYPVCKTSLHFVRGPSHLYTETKNIYSVNVEKKTKNYHL